jgi:hypothetical protein
MPALSDRPDPRLGHSGLESRKTFKELPVIQPPTTSQGSVANKEEIYKDIFLIAMLALVYRILARKHVKIVGTNRKLTGYEQVPVEEQINEVSLRGLASKVPGLGVAKPEGISKDEIKKTIVDLVIAFPKISDYKINKKSHRGIPAFVSIENLDDVIRRLEIALDGALRTLAIFKSGHQGKSNKIRKEITASAKNFLARKDIDSDSVREKVARGVTLRARNIAKSLWPKLENYESPDQKE